VITKDKALWALDEMKGRLIQGRETHYLASIIRKYIEETPHGVLPAQPTVVANKPMNRYSPFYSEETHRSSRGIITPVIEYSSSPSENDTNQSQSHDGSDFSGSGGGDGGGGGASGDY
jgi:uncharacterized membrane protein YgcG